MAWLSGLLFTPFVPLISREAKAQKIIPNIFSLNSYIILLLSYNDAAILYRRRR